MKNKPEKPKWMWIKLNIYTLHNRAFIKGRFYKQETLIRKG